MSKVLSPTTGRYFVYGWDDETAPLADRFTAAKLEIDRLWATLHDIAHYNINNDLTVIQKLAREAITEGPTRWEIPAAGAIVWLSADEAAALCDSALRMTP